MRREWIPSDERFFAERRRGRGTGARRSLARARALAASLGIDLQRPPETTLTVVGSKGKGTAATYASATLAAAGLVVGTLTSPGLTGNRERIRIDGQAISLPDYEQLVSEVADCLDRVAPTLPQDGYLSPTGLFTLAGLRHFQAQGCDVAVLEAGMGGRSDEVSLLDPGVLAVTAVFGEHLGTLGAGIAEIAADKLGAATAATPDIVTLHDQSPAARTVAHKHAAALGATLHAVKPTDVRGLPLPAGLSAANAAVGIRAAHQLLRLRHQEPPSDRELAAALGTVRLPGRLSVHGMGDARWLVDCATGGRAVDVALQHCRATLGEPATVLLCLGADKDRDGALAALSGVRVRRVRVEAPHLDFSGWENVPTLDQVGLGALESPVLALGTIYFVGEILATLGVDCLTAFTSARPRLGERHRSSAR